MNRLRKLYGNRKGFFTVAIVSIALGFVTACIDAPSFDDVPEISNPRVIIPNGIVSGALPSDDTIKILFDFADGDGDIGYPQSDSNNIPPEHVFLTLAEFDSTFTNYTIPIIPANGGVDDITGTITLTILGGSGTFFGACNSNPQVTEINYSVYIKDRAGNTSNQIDFATIPLDCP